MIISTQEFCERLKQCLLQISLKLYEKEVQVKLAENVADILNSEIPDTEVDFVAIVVDTSLPNAIEKCKRDIDSIIPLFVATRMCVVNGSCRTGDIELARKLIDFSDQCGIPYFNGEILDKSSCFVTAERIMKLASFSSGYDNGTPGIVPTPKDLKINDK